MNNNPFIWAVVLMLLLVPPVLATHVSFDLGRVNYPDPVIGVTFNEPVMLLDDETNLIYTATNVQEGLVFTPPADAAYSATFEIAPSAGRLKDGEYFLFVTGRNAMGLTNPEPATVSFDVTGLGIRLHNPVNGYSATTPYDVTVETYVLDGIGTIIPFNANCKYLLGSAPFLDNFNNPSWKPLTSSARSNDTEQYAGGGTRHTAAQLETSESTFSVICQHRKKNGEIVTDLAVEEFTVGQLSNPPNITMELSPEHVRNPNAPFTELAVNTDQETTCTISKGLVESNPDIPFGSGTNFSTEHTHIIRYDNNQGVNTDFTGNYDAMERRYTVTCENRAGLTNTEFVSVTINFGETLSIMIDAPPSVTNATTVEARIRTNLPAQCTTEGISMNTEDNQTHTRTLTTSSFANYTLRFVCTDEELSASRNYTFLVDRVPPTLTINATSTCEGTSKAYFSGQDNHRVHEYSWQVIDENDTVIHRGTTAKSTEEVQATTGAWRVYARDEAGNTGLVATQTIIPSQGCNSTSICGDGVLNLGEDCDGLVLGTDAKCSFQNESLLGTIIACNADCTYNLSVCQSVAAGPGNNTSPVGLGPGNNTSPVGLGPGNNTSLAGSGPGGNNNFPGGLDSDDPKKNDKPIGQDPNNPDTEFFEPESTSSFSWLAFILVALGLMLMGGSGYYLYTARPVNTPSPAMPDIPPALGRANTVNLLRERQEASEAFKKKAAEREAERRDVTAAFNTSKEPASKESSAQATESVSEGVSEGTFEDTSESTKEEVVKEAAAKEGTGEKKKKDAFDQLDELIEEAEEEK